MPPGTWTSLPAPIRTTILKHWAEISGHVEGIAAERSALDQAALDQADLVAAERTVAAAEAFGATLEDNATPGDRTHRSQARSTSCRPRLGGCRQHLDRSRALHLPRQGRKMPAHLNRHARGRVHTRVGRESG